MKKSILTDLCTFILFLVIQNLWNNKLIENINILKNYFFIYEQTRCTCIFNRIFQRKISTNRLALVGMAGGRLGRLAASTIRLKFD